MWARKSSLLLAIVMLTAACTTATRTPVPLASGDLPLPVAPLDALPSQGGEAACAGVGLDATLHGSPGDSRVAWLVSATGARIEVVWALGWRARFAPDLMVLDDRGSVVYRAGDHFDGACVPPGGDAGRDALYLPPPPGT